MLADERLIPTRYPKRGPPPWLSGVREALDASAHRAPPLASLAGIAGVHPMHLVKVFRAHFGVSPRNYVQARRIAEASRLLSETDVPLVTLALRLGYHDQCHFTRAFKSRTGVTPGAFRARRGTLAHDPSQAA